MTIAHGQPKYTVEDYMRLPEGERVELIGGEFLVSPSPRSRHQQISLEIARQLANWVKKTGRGKVFEAPMDVILSNEDAVQPDVMYISVGRMDIVTELNIRGAPDLVVEILSPGTEKRDQAVKKSLYERYGVLEYWIVDPEAEAISVYRSSAGKFELEKTATGCESLATPIIEGFAMDLKEVFAP